MSLTWRLENINGPDLDAVRSPDRWIAGSSMIGVCKVANYDHRHRHHDHFFLQTSVPDLVQASVSVSVSASVPVTVPVPVLVLSRNTWKINQSHQHTMASV